MREASGLIQIWRKQQVDTIRTNNEHGNSAQSVHFHSMWHKQKIMKNVEKWMFDFESISINLEGLN